MKSKEIEHGIYCAALTGLLSNPAVIPSNSLAGVVRLATIITLMSLNQEIPAELLGESEPVNA